MVAEHREQQDRRIIVVRERPQCIYGGEVPRGVRRGEHIVPEALGGAVTISQVCPTRTVCNACNNGLLSELDRELCSRSYLSVVASQEIGAHLWQLFDVDHGAGNLLLEAKPDWEAKSVVQYPQMVLDRMGPQIRGDLEEIEHFGREEIRARVRQGDAACLPPLRCR